MAYLTRIILTQSATSAGKMERGKERGKSGEGLGVGCAAN